MKKVFFRLLSVAALCLTGATAQAYDRHAPLQAFIDREKSEQTFKEVSDLWAADHSFPFKQAENYVTKASFFTLDFNKLNQFRNEKNRCIDLAIPNPQGGYFVINLAQYDFLASGFKLATDANGKETPVNYERGLYYRGVVEGVPGSIAAFSFFNNEVSGIFSIPGMGNFVMHPNSLVTEDAGNPSYMLFNDRDLKIKQEGPICSADELPEYLNTTNDEADAVSKNKFNNCKEIQVYLRADYATYLTKNSIVSSVTNQATAVFNFVSTLYRNEGIYLALKTVIVNTASDDYQSLSNSSSAFLTKFGQVTQNSMQGADLAVLYSTRYGGMGGIAWLDVVCSSYNSSQSSGPYAFVNINSTVPTLFTYTWNVNATAHELGHNVGSRHTHWCGWTGGAIDGCYTPLEGSCSMPNPQYPVNDGTIMSYCHLVSGVGVDFANGFGTLPGNKLRSEVNGNKPCLHYYAPNVPVTTANVTTTANRQCTDPNGVTYYWNDGMNADTIQDKIVLKIKAGSNAIGDLDQTGFLVKATTLASYGGGTGVTFNLPSGVPGAGGNNVAMRRFWSITPITQPSSAVDVYVPFTNTDITDVDGSVPGAPAQLSNFSFYNLEASTVSADPSLGLSGATSGNLKVYTYGTTASTTNWKSSPVGTTQYAQFQTTKLVGGAGYINYIHPLDINSVGAESIAVYPNPFSDSWSINVPAGKQMMLQVYTMDGKVMQTQTLNEGINTVNSKQLPTGMFFYRVTSATATYTGSIVKE